MELRCFHKSLFLFRNANQLGELATEHYRRIISTHFRLAAMCLHAHSMNAVGPAIPQPPSFHRDLRFLREDSYRATSSSTVGRKIDTDETNSG